MRHERGGDEKVRRRAVAGYGDVVDHCDAQQRLDVDVVRVRLQRIPKEDDGVDLALRDLGADLLVAAERTALQLLDGQVQVLLQEPAGRAGCDEVVAGQGVPVEARPFEQVLLLVVVCDECDGLTPAEHLQLVGH